MSAKLRVVRHVLPSTAAPGAGTLSLPALIARLAAAKKATALQAPTCVNDEKSPAKSSPATQLAPVRSASLVGDAAGLSAGFVCGTAAVLMLGVGDTVAVAVDVAVEVGVEVGVVAVVAVTVEDACGCAELEPP